MKQEEQHTLNTNLLETLGESHYQPSKSHAHADISSLLLSSSAREIYLFISSYPDVPNVNKCCLIDLPRVRLMIGTGTQAQAVASFEVRTLEEGWLSGICQMS